MTRTKFHKILSWSEKSNYTAKLVYLLWFFAHSMLMTIVTESPELVLCLLIFMPHIVD